MQKKNKTDSKSNLENKPSIQKTGKFSGKDCLQLSCYVIYAMKKWDAFEDTIQIVPVYLTDKTNPCPLVKALPVEKVKKYIRDSIDAMRSVLIDKENNEIDSERCLKTNDAWRCKNCKFKELCQVA